MSAALAYPFGLFNRWPQSLELEKHSQVFVLQKPGGRSNFGDTEDVELPQGAYVLARNVAEPVAKVSQPVT